MQKEKKKSSSALKSSVLLTVPSSNGGQGGVVAGEMSVQEKRILASILPPSPRLPYPLQELAMRSGPPAQEYVIPEDERAKVLKSIYPFSPCPDLNALRFDLHEEKYFAVREFKVIRENERNFLVSPFYANSGGMVIDWLDEPLSTGGTMFCSL